MPIKSPLAHTTRSRDLTNALGPVLRPLVRLMLTHGLQYRTLLELLKSELVQVAAKEFAIDCRIPTTSRISLLTGVHRKDVKRLRAMDSGGPVRTAAPCLGERIIAAWLASARMTTESGGALPLPRLKRVGGTRSFEALVASVSKDLRPRVVLDELVRSGIVRLDRQDRVLLRKRRLAAPKGMNEKLNHFARSGHAHLCAMMSQLTEPDAPAFERSAHHCRLTPQAVAQLRVLAEKLAARQAHALELRAAKSKRATPGRRKLDHCVTFGFYFYGDSQGHGNTRKVMAKRSAAEHARG